MGERFPASPTLLGVVRLWPVASNIAEHLPAGSLINLARSSSSLREALHAFGCSNTREVRQSLVASNIAEPLPAGCLTNVASSSSSLLEDLHAFNFSHSLEPLFTSHLGALAGPYDAGHYVGSWTVLHIGDHRTPYWEGLKKIATFECSSKTHTKGENTKPCLYCSMPICESCIVKHSFGKNEGTFKNRRRFMCQRCWDIGNLNKERRYSGVQCAAGKSSYKSASEASNFCACTGKDGWVCNDCKEKQNADAKASGSKVCSGSHCGGVLEEDKDRRKICLWCDKPVPRGHASIESKIAFDQKIIDVRKAEVKSQTADLQECGPNRHRKMPTLRSKMGDDNVTRTIWMPIVYNSAAPSKPNNRKHEWRKRWMREERRDLWMPKKRRKLKKETKIHELAGGFEDASEANLQPARHKAEEPGQTVKQRTLAAEANPEQSQVPTQVEEEQELDDDDVLTLRDDAVVAEEARRGTRAEAVPQGRGSRRKVVAIQPGELPPQYGLGMPWI